MLFDKENDRLVGGIVYLVFERRQYSDIRLKGPCMQIHIDRVQYFFRTRTRAFGQEAEGLRKCSMSPYPMSKTKSTKMTRMNVLNVGEMDTLKIIAQNVMDRVKQKSLVHDDLKICTMNNPSKLSWTKEKHGES